MNAHSVSRPLCVLLSLLVSVLYSNAQRNAGPKERHPRVTRNHFFDQYPPEFLFIRDGVADEAGNMWFATAGEGIYCYDGTSFVNFTRRDGLCHNDMLCVLKDKSGAIWFGTRNGLVRYKPSGRKPVATDFSNILISENTISKSTHARVPYEYRVADNFVWSIMEDIAGRLWFGTNKGVYIHDPRAYPDNDAPVFTRFPDNDRILNKERLGLYDIQSMLQDRSGNIWFASGYTKGEGICRYDGRSLVNFKPDGITQFRDIIEARDGTLLFLNTFHGAYSYSPSAPPNSTAPTFTNFTKKIGIVNDTIVAMHQDRSGIFWFGLNSDSMANGGKGGVWRYDGKSLRLFTIKDGLSHNCVFGISEDNAGNIWFGTRNSGLCRYDGKRMVDFTER